MNRTMHGSSMIEEPARQVPVVADVDVLVAGGGPAGIAAAIAAAREGARTLLVDRYGYLGGMITGSHVVAILGMGDGHRVVAQGILAEIRERMAMWGGMTMLGDGIDYRVDAEIFKWQAVEMVQEAGADLLLQTQVCAPIMRQGRVAGAYVESKSGRQADLGPGNHRCHRGRRPMLPRRGPLRQRDTRCDPGAAHGWRGQSPGGRLCRRATCRV